VATGVTVRDSANDKPGVGEPVIEIGRLSKRIEALGEVGALDGGGVCRLALTDDDRDGRNLVVQWMRDLGLDVVVDKIGNVVATRAGAEPGPPVMIGSHIDTVATGGLYDGNLGVLAGLELVEALNAADIRTRHPIAVAFFTNEEGARFAPDMMGSAVHQGALALDDALATVGIDGETVAEELLRIGYAGEQPVASSGARAFLELHVEQGPVLEEQGVTIGAVTGVQGISWTEYIIGGTSNHAGTTPMRLRHDAGYVAAAIATEARSLARRMGGEQVATCGAIDLEPNLINVIARRSRVTVDLRNTSEADLQTAEAHMTEFVNSLAADEGVTVETKTLARFEPVDFDSTLVDAVQAAAQELGLSVMRLPSGAGHDAQMFAPHCPTAMVFVPSAGGISHNIREYTAPEHLRAGTEVLARVAFSLANGE
jgi:beta-ureidopropionase / N-carbamoyl-L-amino-acid hydrolase